MNLQISGIWNDRNSLSEPILGGLKLRRNLELWKETNGLTVVYNSRLFRQYFYVFILHS